MACSCIPLNDGVISALTLDYVLFDAAVSSISAVEYLYMQKVNIVETKYPVIIHVDMLYLKRKNPLNHLEKRMSFDECKNEYTCTCINELSFELSLVVKMINILAWDSQLIENQ